MRTPETSHDLWRQAGRRLVAKMIGELLYEEILTPHAAETGFSIALDDSTSYCFEARRGAFGAWHVNPESVLRVSSADEQAADEPGQLAVDARRALRLEGVELADTVRDLLATQSADARLLRDALTAGQLADLSYVELESHGSGHPCIVLNKGRLGFSAGDAGRYTPEARQPIRLIWLAVDRSLGEHHGIAHGELVAGQLDEETRRRFAQALEGSTGSGWAWLPVHPFHWDEAIAPLFAAEIAEGRIIVLGEAPDRHRPLQSVRTLTNVDRPDRFDVKLPLMIRNTLVWRGLALEPSRVAPQVTRWLKETGERDPFLTGECRMHVLGEVASVTVPHPLLAGVADAPYRFHELLGAVWREPLGRFLAPGEHARSMASLLMIGSDGRALVSELVSRSGLAPADWIDRLLGVLLPPLLHWLYQHGVAFCPHGENTVLFFDESEIPSAIAVKDLAEDVNLLPRGSGGEHYRNLPAEADALLLRWPASQLRHSILSAVFAGHFRFFADVVEEHLGMPQAAFWEAVRGVVRAYHDRFPHLSDAFEEFDLLSPEFERICLNREQLLGGGFHDRAERDEDFDLVVGMVTNPIGRAT